MTRAGFEPSTSWNQRKSSALPTEPCPHRLSLETLIKPTEFYTLLDDLISPTELYNYSFTHWLTSGNPQTRLMIYGLLLFRFNSFQLLVSYTFNACHPAHFEKVGNWKTRVMDRRRRSWSGFRREYEKKLARFFCKIIFVECAPSNHMLVAEWRSVFANGPVPPKVNGILGVVPPTFCNQVQWQNRVHNLPLYFTRKDMIKLNQPSSGRAWRRVRPFAAYSPCPALSSCESSRSPW